MYGFDELIATVKAAELNARKDGNRYLAQAHSWYPSGTPRTWGVARYVPYCEQMPERFDGFVWLNPADVYNIVPIRTALGIF